MHSARLCFAAALVICSLPATAADTCAITTKPNPQFNPPVGFSPDIVQDPRAFHFGTPGLWAWITPRWQLGGNIQNKLPYFSVYFDWQKETKPRMTVEARRLDAPAPAVPAEPVIRSGPSSRAGEQPDLSRPGAMLTAIKIPAAGCWEITARYTPPSGKIETLSYTILVQP